MFRTSRALDRSEAAWNKVFSIGANKTGTTTLERVFRDLRLRVPSQQKQEQFLTRKVLAGDMSGLQKFCGPYDAFQDLPFSSGLVFAACDALFPDAKFILTMRDPEGWFDSICRFQAKVFGLNTRDDPSTLEKKFKTGISYIDSKYAHEVMQRNLLRVSGNDAAPDWSLIYDRESYIARYQARNDLIIQHFWNRCGKLLVLNLERERSTKKIVDFLGLNPNLIAPMPHENPS